MARRGGYTERLVAHLTVPLAKVEAASARSRLLTLDVSGHPLTYAAGQAIYKDSCAACHFDTGEGQARMYPRLALGPFVQSAQPTTLIRVVLNGMRSVGTQGQPTAPAMPAYGWKLNDDQVAAVVTYIRNTWGNAASTVTASDVSKLRDELAKRGD